ncbi:MAG: hypothetical protein JKY21_03915 [Alcanivorax sp.]|nr:hypothetical protein [Alcanivorax sp.]
MIKRIAFFLVLNALFSAAYASVGDYDLRRLPASLGNEFTNANGHVRQFMPTTINNQGLMAGTRMTWIPDGNGGVSAIQGQASYIYDLESRSYVADFIVNMAITYIGDSSYIAKRLHPAGTRWQTYRCPISGLVEDMSRGVWENPSCTLLDNDYLDQQIPQSDWAGAFLLFNVVRAGGDQVYGSNPEGSTVVMDFPDDFYNGNSGEYTYYRHDGVSVHSSEAPQSWNNLADNPVSIMHFGHESGSDVVYTAQDANSSSSPAKVLRYQMPDNLTDPVVSQTVIDWIDPSTGEYVNVAAINESGDVLTERGICSLSDGCNSKNNIDFTGSAGAIGPFLMFDDEVLAARYCSNGAGSDCLSDFILYDVGSEQSSFLSDLVFDKFSEVLDYDTPVFTLPVFATVIDSDLDGRMIFSRNGKYLVFLVRDVGGSINRYVMKKN